MDYIKFNKWLSMREASAFTRLRRGAAQGTMPPIPDAAINSRSTASQWEIDNIKGKGVKKCKRKDESIIEEATKKKR